MSKPREPAEISLNFIDDVATLSSRSSSKSSDIPIVSILCVNYFSDEKVKAMITSFKSSTVSHECIVIDNSNHNRGYGAAINLGAIRARGNYLLILNPDCLGNADLLSDLLKSSARLNTPSCIAPQLLGSNNLPYLSTTSKLGWLQMVVSHSVINKWWRSNPISREFWYDDFNLNESRFVEQASGAALFLPKDIFESVGGFDEDFFLYFEDVDFCRRLRKAGILIYFDSNCKVIHQRGGATPNIQKATTFFRQSRWKYSVRYFGLIPALVSEGWLRIQEKF